MRRAVPSQDIGALRGRNTQTPHRNALRFLGWSLNRPVSISHGCLFAATIAIFVAASELDPRTIVFGWACTGFIYSIALLLSARLKFSAVVTALIVGLIVALSFTKFLYLHINLHVLDFYQHLNRESFRFFLFAVPFQVAALSGVVLVALVCLVAMLRLEAARPFRRWAMVFLSPLAASIHLLWPVNLAPAKTGHFFTAFIVSLPDVSSLYNLAEFKRRLQGANPTFSFPVAEDCQPNGKIPDIVLVLSESTVPPGVVPGWEYGPALSRTFLSHDGILRPARVETYGGGTWVSWFQVLTGLSAADFGPLRSYVTMFLEGKIRHSLPKRLAECGYRTVHIQAFGAEFLNISPFMSSIGFTDVLDRRGIGAPPRGAHEYDFDAVYYGSALDIIEQHRRASGKPIFIALETMVPHMPYTGLVRPGIALAGEPFHSDAAVNEYIRRLSFARTEMQRFMRALESGATDRGVLVATFGDHHPYITSRFLSETEGEDLLSRPTSKAYETYYSLHPLRMKAAAPLPNYPILSLSYLDLSILETAGIPLGRIYEAKRALRESCAGVFGTCGKRESIDAFLRGLSDAGLLVPP